MDRSTASCGYGLRLPTGMREPVLVLPSLAYWDGVHLHRPLPWPVAAGCHPPPSPRPRVEPGIWNPESGGWSVEPSGGFPKGRSSTGTAAGGAVVIDGDWLVGSVPAGRNKSSPGSTRNGRDRCHLFPAGLLLLTAAAFRPHSFGAGDARRRRPAATAQERAPSASATRRPTTPRGRESTATAHWIEPRRRGARRAAGQRYGGTG